MAIAEDNTLAERARLLEEVVGNFPGGICLFDRDLKLVVCNEQQKQLLEYPDDLFADGPPSLTAIFRFNALRGEYGPGDVEEQVGLRLDLARKMVEHRYERTRPNGTVLDVRGIPLRGGGFLTTYVDVTEKRRAEAAVVRMAYHDPLTGLPNRALLSDRLETVIARGKRGAGAAVFYLDLNKFKPVNDCYGHAAGDELLKQVADRLRVAVRETDTVARVGGDEFVIIQTDVAHWSMVALVAERILNAFGRPFELEGQSVEIGTSMGIALTPEHGQTVDDLLKKADSALYKSKLVSGNHYTFASDLDRVWRSGSPP